MHLQCDVERISRYSFYKYYLLFNFASSISYTIKCPSALGFGLPYPKSTTAVLLLKKEMRCISSVMLNAARYIHFINDFYYCSILPFRYINVSSFIQSFLTWKQFWIFNFASSISCTIIVSICTRFSPTISKIHFFNSEMWCIFSVMFNASQDTHFIKHIYNCSILHFRYINVSSLAQSNDIKKNLDIQFLHLVCPAQSSVHPYPKSTTAVLFFNSEMRCISSVMLNASQDIHLIKDICNCSILHFRYINVSNLAQFFLWH